MARARDVAAAIIEIGGPVDPLNLQKLLYYVQGWHLAWFDKPLFPEQVQAWPIGPAVYDVYKTYRHYKYQPIERPEKGDAGRLTDRQRAVVKAILDAYPERRGMDLALRTHEEDPWLRARSGLTPAQPSMREISRRDMKTYFRHVPLGLEPDEVSISEAEAGLLKRATEGDETAMTVFLEGALGSRLSASSA